ncbi:MAG: HAD family hydrolase [Corynebacterium sp.]|nr:HAD family hydrolase [Corynebacterium sp.]
MYRFILFDLDDTLIDSAYAAEEGSRAWSIEIGIEPNPKRWKDLEKKWYTKFEQGLTSYEGQRVGRVRDYTGNQQLSDAQALAIMESFYPHYLNNIHAFADAAPALSAAAATGARTGIFTNGGNDLQTAKTKAAGLWNDEQLFFTAAEMPAPKPQPESYEFIIQKLGCQPEEIVMIGDNFDNDSVGPARAGWHTIFLDRHANNAQSAAIPGLIASVSTLADIDFGDLK